MRRLLTLCATPLLAASAGCGTLIGGKTEVVPVADTRPFKIIKASCKDTPETRKQVDQHNSVLDTLRSGKRVVYKDDCEEAKPTT